METTVTENKERDNQSKPQPTTAVLELSIRRKELNFGLPGSDPTIASPKIGSSLKGRAPLSGLSLEEEKKYLPEVIGTSPSDVNWRKEVRDYWNNISERVPHDSESADARLPGRVIRVEVVFPNKQLAADFEKANSFDKKALIMELGEIVPADTADYILFRYVLVYRKVANDMKDMYKSNGIRFYLYSKDQQTKQSYSSFKLRTRAMNLFVTVMEDSDKVDAILRLFNQDPDNENVFPLVEDKHLILEDLIKANPKKFLDYANDKELKAKSFILKAVDKGFIVKPPNTDSYYYGDDREVLLGHSLMDAVHFIKNKDNKNMQIVDNIKAQMKY